MVSLPDATATGRVVFGKNSDRPAGECQIIYDSAGEDRSSGAPIRAAFVEVPEGPAPLRTIGCRPYWCWGYETGLNEAGVAGGNTAVYTRSFSEPENRERLGLTGMELLRLGLERGRTAEDVVLAIADLLEQYGQWAPAVIAKRPPDGCYENAFLIADKSEAWILETTGRRWVARRYTTGAHALSNQLTIRNRWTRGSDDVVDYATRQRWWTRDSGPLDFALAYSDHEHYARQVSHIRWCRARELLNESEGHIDADTMMLFLRDHYEGTFLQGPQFNEYLPDFLTLCMHDSPAGFTWGNTATSVVIEIDPNSPVRSPFWCTFQPPCSSVYLLCTIAGGLPTPLSTPGTAGLRSQSPVSAPLDTFAPGSLWWRMFRIVQAVSTSPVPRKEVLRSLFDPIERKYLARVRKLAPHAPHSYPEALRASADAELTEILGVLDHLERAWNLQPG